jgi:hypothetical protein
VSAGEEALITFRGKPRVRLSPAAVPPTPLPAPRTPHTAPR